MWKEAISSDPKQQALRDLKKQWQKEMRTFIAQNIALKRGISGVGDARAGIPPSKIKDPLPDEVPIYIDEMVTRFNNLVDIAKQIVSTQEEYSATRRKGRKEMEGIASVDDGLQKVASNKLTRLWARWTQMPWGNGHQETRAKLSLMSSLAELKDQINDIEFVLAGTDKQSVPHAFFSFLHFVQFVNRFIDKFNKEIERQANEISGIELNDVDKFLSQPVQLPSDLSDGFREALERSKKRKEDTEKEDKTQDNNRVSFIKKDVEAVEFIISQINAAKKDGKIVGDPITDTTISQIRDSVKDILRTAMTIESTGEGSVKDLELKYSALLEIVRKMIGSDYANISSFADILDKLSGLVKGASKEILLKLAKKQFERWVRRSYLSAFTDEFSKTKLETVRKLRDLSNTMNSVLDLLEQRDSKLGELFWILAKMYSEIGIVSIDFINFANYHNAEYGKQRASGKKVVIGPINQDVIRFLINNVNHLKSEVKKTNEGSVIKDDSEEQEKDE